MQTIEQTPLTNLRSKDRIDEDSLETNNIDESSDSNIVISRSDEQIRIDNALTLSLSAVNPGVVNSFQDRGVESTDKSQQPIKEGFNSSFNNLSIPPNYSKVQSKPVDYRYDPSFSLNERYEIKMVFDDSIRFMYVKKSVQLPVEHSQTWLHDQGTLSMNIADQKPEGAIQSSHLDGDNEAVQNPLAALTLDDILLNKALPTESHAFIWDDANQKFTQVAAVEFPKPAGGIWTPCDAHSDVIELVEQYPLVDNTLYKDEAGQSYIFCESYIPEPPSGYALDTLLYYLKPTYWGGYEISGSLIQFVELPHANNLTDHDDGLKALSLLDVIKTTDNVLDSLNSPLSSDTEAHRQETSLSSSESNYHFVVPNIDLSTDSNFET